MQAVAQRVFQQLTPQVTAGQVIAFAPPAAFELGNATGFDLELEDVGNVGHDEAAGRPQPAAGAWRARTRGWRRCAPTGSTTCRSSSSTSTTARAGAFGLSQADINTTVSAAFGRRLRQPVHRPRPGEEGVHPGRRAVPHQPEDLDNLYVRGSTGTMAPVSAFANSEWIYGPDAAGALQRPVRRSRSRARRRPARAPATAMARMEALIAKTAARHRLRMDRPFLRGEGVRRRRPAALYALSLLVVFLCLAALYESWSVPIAVLLVVPLGVIGALLAAHLTRPRQRHLFPGRPDHHDRRLGQERHPDRRVRRGAAEAGA